MRIATWNVNSVRARVDRLVAWLDKQQPDVLCLQELKGIAAAFPADAVAEVGYRAAVHGQKTYNGVAILSRSEPVDVRRGMGDGVNDPQARLISAAVEGVRVISAYFPNGRTVGCEAYAYKLEWMGRLRAHLAEEYSPDEMLALCGDFNVAVDDGDIRNPDAWAESVLCDAETRDVLADIRQWGMADVFRPHHPAGGVYSWWDYRNIGFRRNDGLRIDHIYATGPMAECCTAAEVDRDERKGSKPSDHAPVIATFEL